MSGSYSITVPSLLYRDLNRGELRGACETNSNLDPSSGSRELQCIAHQIGKNDFDFVRIEQAAKRLLFSLEINRDASTFCGRYERVFQSIQVIDQISRLKVQVKPFRLEKRTADLEKATKEAAVAAELGDGSSQDAEKARKAADKAMAELEPVELDVAVKREAVQVLTQRNSQAVQAAEAAKIETEEKEAIGLTKDYVELVGKLFKVSQALNQRTRDSSGRS